MRELKLILKHAFLIFFSMERVLYIIQFTKTYTERLLTFTEHYAKHVIYFISFNSYECSLR